MANPSDLKYTKEHEWIKIDGDIATCGITDFAQKLLTDIVFVELPEIGKKAEKSKPIAVVESVKSVSDVFAPLSGEVVEINSELENSPETINKDAFGKGWLFKIKISKKDEINDLMSAEEYDKFISKG